jgi:hypothetical protein
MTPLGFVMVTLAVWRVTHLFAEEDGPGRLFARLRALGAPNGFWASLFGCFYCFSLWVALPFAWLASEEPWGRRLIAWLAVSGAACLLQRLSYRPEPPALFYEGDQEEHHELLRRSADRDDATGEA